MVLEIRSPTQDSLGWNLKSISRTDPSGGSRRDRSLAHGPLPSSKPVKSGVFLTWHHSDTDPSSAPHLSIFKAPYDIEHTWITRSLSLPSGQLTSNLNSTCVLNFPLPCNVSIDLTSMLRVPRSRTFGEGVFLCLPQISSTFLIGSILSENMLSCSFKSHFFKCEVEHLFLCEEAEGFLFS